MNPVSLIPKSIFSTAKNRDSKLHFYSQVTIEQIIPGTVLLASDFFFFFLPHYLVVIVQMFGFSGYLIQFNFFWFGITEETEFLLLSLLECESLIVDSYICSRGPQPLGCVTGTGPWPAGNQPHSR